MVATVALGLLSRSVHTGVALLDKSLGDALYAAMIYWAAAFLFPGSRPLHRLSMAAGFCFAIEAFKLTGLPAAWAHWRLSRLVFGASPSVHNLVCYLAGAAAAALLDTALLRGRPRKLD